MSFLESMTVDELRGMRKEIDKIITKKLAVKPEKVARVSKRVGERVGILTCVAHLGGNNFLFDCDCGTKGVKRSSGIFIKMKKNVSCGCLKQKDPVDSCNGCIYDVSTEEFLRGMTCKTTPKVGVNGKCLSRVLKQVRETRW